MQITRETDYAMRCVLYLSGQPDKVVMVDEISREMATPKSFLAKILQKLVKADVVRSFRGVKGGFQLSREPRDINLLDVIEAIEGVVALNACAVDSSVCSFSGTCGVHTVWVTLRAEVNELMKKHNFADIAEATKRSRES
ncbi:MAG: Rrf2 family transcriptional regulator [Nitrospirae bacterium]|nr:Rrf2 family transcriptional regulator [Nitrospirota bacterium]